MSKFLKILIITLIFIFLSTVISILFLFNIFKIDKFNFINTLQEKRYTDDLKELSIIIDNSLNNKNKSVINKYINLINFEKFSDKKRSKNFDVAQEISAGKNLILDEDNLEKIKFYDNSKKLIFSTDESEKKGKAKGNYISFESKDGIEKQEDFFIFNDKELNFLIDTNKKSLILKKNILFENKSIGIMLFYFDNLLLIDTLRKNNIYNFKPSLLENNIIVLNRPQLVTDENLKDLRIEQKDIITSYEDQFGNAINKEYKIFYENFKHSNLTMAKFVDKEKLIFNNQMKNILFYFSVFTLYLLVLAFALLLDKSKYNKLKGRASLFTAAILEEIIEAKTKEELGKIQRRLEIKKENTIKALFNNKKIKEKDISDLKEHLNIVFDKIKETLDDKLRNFSDSGGANLDKVESLLEKFVNSIAEKGIQINSPVNISNTTAKSNLTPIDVEEIQDVEAVEELGEIEEIEEIQEIEDAEELDEAEEIQEVQDAEAVEEPGEIEEIEEIQEIEDAEELDDAEEIQEVQDAEAVEEPGEIEEIEEIQEIEDAEELDEAEKIQEIQDIEAVEEPGKTEEIEEIQEIEDAEELDEAEEIQEVQDAEAVDESRETEEVKTKVTDSSNSLEMPEVQVAIDINDIEQIEQIDSKNENIDITDETIKSESDNEMKFGNEDLNDDKIEGIDGNENDPEDNYYYSNEFRLGEYIQHVDEIEIDVDNPGLMYHEIEERNSTENEDDISKLDDSINIKSEPDINDESGPIEEPEEETKEKSGKNNSPIFDQDITIDDLFSVDDMKLKDIKQSEDEVPKIPEEYYENNSKNDDLAKEIKKLSDNRLEEEKTPLQLLLEKLYQKLEVSKLSLLINTNDKNSFMMINQIGFNINHVIKINFDESNPLIHHIYNTQRMVFVANPEKFKGISDNLAFEKNYSDMNSLFIYPIKFFGRIRSIMLLFFKNDRSEYLDELIDEIENNKTILRKNVLKII